jgi:hypothetical protein
MISGVELTSLEEQEQEFLGISYEAWFPSDGETCRNINYMFLNTCDLEIVEVH